jgi:hypothetical protein
MAKSKFFLVKTFILFVLICLLGFVAFWVIDNRHYFYTKYNEARIDYNRTIKQQVSAYFPKGSVIVELDGGRGLGNQLFQYAAAHNLAKQTGSKLYVLVRRTGSKLHFLTGSGKKKENMKQNTSIYDRYFALHNFNIPMEQVVFRDEITNTPTKLEVKYVDDQNFFQLKTQKNEGILFLKSAVESEIYFEEVKDEIQNLFVLKGEDFSHLDEKLKEVSKPNSYCIHMRKGDMLRDNYQYFLSSDYQKEAMKLINNITDKPKFFVFSDSPEVAKRELQDDKIEFFSYKQLEDFWLMSNCSNNIVANSTFSWWAAYLNKNESKIVIAPYHRWHDLSYYYLWGDAHRYNKRKLYKNSAYPKDWILLDHEKHDLAQLVKENVAASEQAEILKHYKEKPFNIYSGDGLELSLCENEQNAKYNICKTDHEKTLPTVVTAYFKVKNKHTDEEFDSWMRRFLSVPNNLIVFTDKAHSGQIKEMRGDLPIIIIEKNLKDFYHYKYYDRYKEMYEIDEDKRHSPELYIIWAEKVKFVNEAIKLDPYKSEFFIWTDIGIIREDEYLDTKYHANTHMVSNKMSFFSIADFSTTDIITKAPKYSDIRMAGNVQIGDKFAWKLYNHLWDKIIESYLEKSFMITNDQAIIGAVILTYPEIARIIYPDIRFTGNPWWYSLLYLSDSEKTQE